MVALRGSLPRVLPSASPTQSVHHKMTSALLTILLLAATALCANAADSARFPWLTDLAAARELAATQSKPLLIVFRCEP